MGLTKGPVKGLYHLPDGSVKGGRESSSSVCRHTKPFIRPSLSPSLWCSSARHLHGMGRARGSCHPVSSGTACGIGSASPPWSRRTRARWCASERDASCRTTPLREEEKQGKRQRTNRRRRRKTRNKQIGLNNNKKK